MSKTSTTNFIPNTVLKELKKGDEFKFNYDIFTVKRKFISDDKPMITTDDHRWYHDELEIEKISI